MDVWSVEDDVFERVLIKFRRRDSEYKELEIADYFSSGAERLLTVQQKLRAKPRNKVIELRNIELDGFYFAPYTEQFKTDNSCVMCEYNEEDEEEEKKTICYGRIRAVFKHTLYTNEEGEPVSNVFLDCDWYSVDEDCPQHELTGLTRIRRNLNFDKARISLATHILPVHLTFWPEDPFDKDCETYLVIHQRDRDPAYFVH